jgi:hypothetical protein
MAGLKSFWRSNHQIRTDKTRDHSPVGGSLAEAQSVSGLYDRYAADVTLYGLDTDCWNLGCCLRLSGNGSTR